jgi:hypothetical protein
MAFCGDDQQQSGAFFHGYSEIDNGLKKKVAIAVSIDTNNSLLRKLYHAADCGTVACQTFLYFLIPSSHLISTFQHGKP